MDSKQMLDTLDRLLEEAKVAILANNDENGKPQMRWMSPGIIRGYDGLLFAVTSPQFAKAAQLEKNPSVMWMIQNDDKSEILSIRGSMKVLDNPSLQSTVLESLGPKLAAFWKINDNDTDIVVLVTTMLEIEYFSPSKGIKEQTKIISKEAK